MFNKLCPSSGKRTWCSSILVLIPMAHTDLTCCYWQSRYCLSCVRSLASSLFFSKTEPLEIAVWNGRHLLSFHQTCGSLQSISEPSWLQNLGRRWSGCTRRKFMTLMNWSSVCRLALGLCRAKNKYKYKNNQGWRSETGQTLDKKTMK